MVEEHSMGDASGELPPIGRLRWNCRRGMKELEVLLLPYVDHCYPALALDRQWAFIKILGFDDASLYAWFMGYETPEEPELIRTIQEVHSAVADLVSNTPGFKQPT